MQYATSETVKYLFVKFQARYGSKFISQYPPDLLPVVQKEWLNELKNMTADDIKRGVDNWQESWPPNIVDFKNACKKPAVTPAYREYKCLEQQAIDPAKARENIQKMREVIAGTKVLVDEDIMQGNR